MPHTTLERHVYSFYKSAKDLPESVKHILWPCSIYQCTLNLANNATKLNMFEMVIIRLMATGVSNKEQLSELTCLPVELVYSIQLGLQSQRFLDLDFNLTELAHDFLTNQDVSDSVSFGDSSDSKEMGLGGGKGFSYEARNEASKGVSNGESIKLYLFLDDISGEILSFATTALPQQLLDVTLEQKHGYSFGQVGAQDYFLNPLILQADQHSSPSLKRSAVSTMLHSFQRHKQRLESNIKFQPQRWGGINYQRHTLNMERQGSLRLIISTHATPIYLHCLGELGMSFRVYDPCGLDLTSQQLTKILQQNQHNNELLRNYLKSQHVVLNQIVAPEQNQVQPTLPAIVYDEQSQALFDSLQTIKNAYQQMQTAQQHKDFSLIYQSYGDAIRQIYSNLEELIPKTLELTKQACNLFELNSASNVEVLQIFGTNHTNEKLFKRHLKEQGFITKDIHLSFSKNDVQQCYNGQLDYLDLTCCVILELQRHYAKDLERTLKTNSKLSSEVRTPLEFNQSLPAAETIKSSPSSTTLASDMPEDGQQEAQGEHVKSEGKSDLAPTKLEQDETTEKSAGQTIQSEQSVQPEHPEQSEQSEQSEQNKDSMAEDTVQQLQEPATSTLPDSVDSADAVNSETTAPAPSQAQSQEESEDAARHQETSEATPASLEVLENAEAQDGQDVQVQSQKGQENQENQEQQSAHNKALSQTSTLVTLTPRLYRLFSSLSAQEPEFFDKLQKLRLERNSSSHGDNFAHQADPDKMKKTLGLFVQVLTMLYDENSSICTEAQNLLSSLSETETDSPFIGQDRKTLELLIHFDQQQLQALPDIIYNVSQDILDLESPGQNLVNDLYQVTQQLLHNNFNLDKPLPEQIKSLQTQSLSKVKDTGKDQAQTKGKQQSQGVAASNQLRIKPLTYAKTQARNAGFNLKDNKLPQGLLTVKPRFLFSALNQQTHTSLGAEVIAFLVFTPLDKLKLLAKDQPDALNLLCELITLRGHGNNQTPRTQACELKNRMFTLYQHLLRLN